MSLRPLWDGFGYKKHQETGVSWMIDREQCDPAGGILCDEMGLGKTIQMLGLMKNRPAAKATLLLAPVAVLNQWADTARKSGIAVYRPKLSNRHCSWVPEGRVPFQAPKLHLIGYELARIHHQFVTQFEWDRIVCDEAHRVSNSKSGLNALINLIKAPNRWFLTATPIVNDFKEIRTLLEMVGHQAVPFAGDPKLEQIIHDTILYRSMEDLRSAIPDAPPPPVTHTLSLPFASEFEADFYHSISGKIIERWKALDVETGAGTGLMKLKLFMHLRQLSLHPQVFIDAKRKAMAKAGMTYGRDDFEGSSTKFDAIRELLEKDPGHKWIIFCHFHQEMELLKATLETEGRVRNVHMYNGTMSHAERQKVLELTKEPLPNSSMTDILLIQLQSGGVGLNLQHFDRVVFSGPWWTSALMEQAIGRAVRIGQREVVHVFHLKLKEEEVLNIDAMMMAKAEEKGSMCRDVLEMACRDI